MYPLKSLNNQNKYFENSIKYQIDTLINIFF